MNTLKAKSPAELAVLFCCGTSILIGCSSVVASQSADGPAAGTGYTVYEKWPAETPLTETTKTSWGQMGVLADLLNADQYFVLPDEQIIIHTVEDAIDYSGRHLGGTHQSGDVLGKGVWFFPSESVIQYENGDVEILEYGTVMIRHDEFAPQSIAAAEAHAASNRCTLATGDCTNGRYACCRYGDNGRPTCKCRRASVPDDDCDAGGHQSVGCSLTQDSIVFDEGPGDSIGP